MVVVLHHASAMHINFASSIPAFEIGAFGVDIFFVISGFIMWTMAAARPMTPADFMRRRIIRIVPLYWIFTLVTAYASTDHGVSVNLFIDYKRLFRSLFFIPQWHENYPQVAPNMLVGWTLNLEMVFYLVFAATLVVSKKLRFPIIAAVFAVSAAIRFFMPEPTHPAINLYSKSIILEFVFGMGLGWAFARGFPGDRIRTLQPWRVLGLGLGAVLLGIDALSLKSALPPVRALYWGAPALLICVGALIMEPIIAKRPVAIFKFLGDASYSIYLSHIIAMAISHEFIGAQLSADFPWPVLTGEILFAVVFGCLVHVALEKPVTKRVRQLWSSRTVNPQAAQTSG